MATTSPSENSGKVDQSAVRVAELAHNDFRNLTALFDRQLMNGAGGPDALPTICEARAAAYRGVELTRKLMELLRDERSL
jgi:hypothetical protein